MYSFWILLLALAGVIPAYELPPKLSEIYESHKSGKCNNVLGKGFSDGSSGHDVVYCGDIKGAIYLHTSAQGGAYGDMDVDCDGADNGAGACSNDPSGQGQTAFKDEVSKYGISDLNANVHPYVVFGNEDSSPTFNPRKYGMEPLSVMAIVCNGQLHYGIWGDTNGGTSTGEASISLAKLCFPDDHITGDNGHSDKDVLYIGFTDKDAVPGKEADWTARDSKSFEQSIKSLGDRLVAKLTGSSATRSSSSIPSSTWTQTLSTTRRPTHAGHTTSSRSSSFRLAVTPSPSSWTAVPTGTTRESRPRRP